MPDQTIIDLASFASWARKAKPGTVAVYYYTTEPNRDPVLFDYARSLHIRGQGLLFQRRDGRGNWEYCIQRITKRTHGFIAKVSALTAAPYNSFAQGWKR